MEKELHSKDCSGHAIQDSLLNVDDIVSNNSTDAAALQVPDTPSSKLAYSMAASSSKAFPLGSGAHFVSLSDAFETEGVGALPSPRGSKRSPASLEDIPETGSDSPQPHVSKMLTMEAINTKAMN